MIGSLNYPGLSSGHVDKAVGFAVVNKPLFFRVPFERTFQFVGREEQVTHCRGMDGVFDVTERSLACLDTVNEVPVDAAGSRVTGHRFGGTFFIRADDMHVASAWVIVMNQLAVWIAAGGKLLAAFVMEDDFLGLQFPDVNGECGAAEMMGAPVGHAAAGVILE